MWKVQAVETGLLSLPGELFEHMGRINRVVSYSELKPQPTAICSAKEAHGIER